MGGVGGLDCDLGDLGGMGCDFLWGDVGRAGGVFEL